ncbi:hypothetical protein Lal_00003720 [Lupinus albus]|uniref:Uncharacterized protein n=1 Tax=Lupinus albus TaxID=3870 RepID=A0A6A4Q335_LUPAL|nr:hypothetical protein Lalb_Chr08g0231951 [Lupinus albus]KAF1870514.1 hypothetical protein Lal_00003720 [Lupinus albus]
MRSGACTLQQTLTAEAASILKHSLVLARRRGHAQVTPLHVAATLLSLRASSPFKRACLKSQPQFQTSSHPLQCKALELCFNVALNKLPTTQGPSLLHNQPSLSNALIAALKRAQAHQRRGCIEQQQQQPLFIVKVELEQLIISILDDPSVSRVMREAGFSSIAVKNNMEHNKTSTTSVFHNNSVGAVFSSPTSPSENQRKHHFLGSYTNSHDYNTTQVLFSSQKKAPLMFPITHEEDIKMVLDILLRKNKKKNSVIVGDSLSLNEGLVDEIMRKFERGEVPNELKTKNFIKFQFSTLRFMNKDEVKMNLSYLKKKVDSVTSSRRGAIFYVGDLKWIVEGISLCEKEGGWGSYNHVDHVVEEIGKLFYELGNSNTTKVCLIGTASYQTYMRCQMRQPPLETQWNLQAVSVPSAGLGFTLHASSVYDSSYPWWPNQTSVFTDSSSISFADSATTRPAYMYQQSCTIEFNFSNDVADEKKEETTILDSIKSIVGNSTYSDGSREKVENICDNTTLVQQAHICKMLQENVPWHSEKVTSISEALVLGCSKSARQKSTTWLFMQGNDYAGKTRLGRAIAESFFGSVNDDKFLHLDMMIKTCEEIGTKTPFSEMLDAALKSHEQLVILIENVDSADAHFKKFLADKFETLKLGNLCTNEENSCNAIFILSNDGCTKRTYNNKNYVMKLVLQVSETNSTLKPSSSPCFSHKRNLSELDLFTKIKKARNEEKEFARESRFNTLDLNIKAEDYEENSPNSSDSTREIVAYNLNSNEFVNSIKNRFELNQSPTRERKMKEMFMLKIKGSFEEVYGVVNFSVEDKVIEEIGVGCGCFTNSVFEKWLKDIFQTSLRIVNFGGKEKENEGIVFTLCWGGKGHKICDSGFMSSCLPNNIQVNY